MLDPPFQDVERLKRDPAMTLLQTADLGQQYLTFDQCARRTARQRRQGPQPVQGPARAARRVPRDQRRPDRRRRCCAARRRRPAPSCRRASTAACPSSTSACPSTRRRRARCSPRPGYPNGFAVTLDCVNIAYRETVCQAVAAMLTQVGIRTTFRSSPTNQFFPKLTQAHRQLHRVRLDADHRRLGDAERLFRTWTARTARPPSTPAATRTPGSTR